jgi:hypothetical protein
MVDMKKEYTAQRVPCLGGLQIRHGHANNNARMPRVLIRVWGITIAGGLLAACCGSGDISLDGGYPDGAEEDACTSDLGEFAGLDEEDHTDIGRELDEPGDSGSDGGDTGAADPHQICVDKINALRATKGLVAYSRWVSAEACVDGQATADEQANSPHGAFGQCGEYAQNECLGGGASGIEHCLESMWAEKDQPGCTGCDACADAYNPNCPNCDFYGDQTGNVCGHYVNMSAKYFHQAACGFSAGGNWAAIDFK